MCLEVLSCTVAQPIPFMSDKAMYILQPNPAINFTVNSEFFCDVYFNVKIVTRQRLQQLNLTF